MTAMLVLVILSKVLVLANLIELNILTKIERTNTRSLYNTEVHIITL
jgi:hypothetical protein